MPIEALDILLLVVMLVSAFLAMVRGFMREILSIASWATAAIVALYFSKRLVPAAKQYITNDYLATAAVILGLFLGTLLVVSIITIKISDMILDSRVGALDRTLGFLFGLGRGLVVVVAAYMFFAWFVPDNRQPGWITNAKSLVVIRGTGDWLIGILREVDTEGYLQRFLRQRKIDDQEPDTPPGERGALDAPFVGDRMIAVTPRASETG